MSDYMNPDQLDNSWGNFCPQLVFWKTLIIKLLSLASTWISTKSMENVDGYVSAAALCQPDISVRLVGAGAKLWPSHSTLKSKLPIQTAKKTHITTKQRNPNILWLFCFVLKKYLLKKKIAKDFYSKIKFSFSKKKISQKNAHFSESSKFSAK